MSGVAANWFVDGGGTIDSTGLFTAGGAAGGPFTVTAAVPGAIAGTAQVTVESSTTVTLAPAADAYVRDGTSAATNFGTATSLVVKATTTAGNNRITYLRFPLTSVSGAVGTARLRLFGSRPAATSITDSAFAVSDNTWTEAGLTWNNRPPIGARQGTGVVISTTAQYHEMDVTAFVRAQRAAGATAVSLAVQMDTQVPDSPDTFNSREASANPPQLQVTFTPDSPPTVAVPAAASPSTVSGKTTQLSVLGADDAGEAALTYTWAAVGSPAAAVAFSVNGSNAAKNTIATFAAAGSYDLEATVRDTAGNTVTSRVTVRVDAVPTGLAVTPASASVALGGQVAFVARAADQFGRDLGPQAALWSVSGGGSIDQSGVFTAGNAVGGPFTITASANGLSATASVTVTGATTTTLSAVADAYVRDGTSAGTNFGTAANLDVKTTATSGNNRITFVRFPLSGLGSNVISAKLRLFGHRPTATSATTSASAVSSNTWTETGITWNNKPAVGARQGAGIVVSTTAQYFEWDVTEFVRAQRLSGMTAVSLAVSMDVQVSEGPDTFNSREATGNRPQLVVTSGP
jgi:hypothetical protein